MGVAFSLEIQGDFFDGLQGWRNEGEVVVDNGMDQINSLVKEIQEVLEHPEDLNKVKNLLMGVEGGMNGSNIVGIFSLLQVAHDKEWIFENVSKYSLAYFELVVILLRWINDLGLEAGEGRANLYLLGLASCAARIAEGLIPPEETVALPTEKPRGRNHKRIYNAIVRPSITAPTVMLNYLRQWKIKTIGNTLSGVQNLWRQNLSKEKAAYHLKSFHNNCRFKFLKYSVAGKSDYKALQIVVKELLKTQSTFEKQAARYYDRRGDKFGLELRNMEDGLDFRFSPNAPFNLSLALMDILLPEEPSMNDPMEAKLKQSITFAKKGEIRFAKDFATNAQMVNFNYLMYMIAAHEPEEGEINSLGHYVWGYIALPAFENSVLVLGKTEPIFEEAMTAISKYYSDSRSSGLWGYWSGKTKIGKLAALETVFEMDPYLDAGKQIFG